MCSKSATKRRHITQHSARIVSIEKSSSLCVCLERAREFCRKVTLMLVWYTDERVDGEVIARIFYFFHFTKKDRKICFDFVFSTAINTRRVDSKMLDRKTFCISTFFCFLLIHREVFQVPATHWSVVIIQQTSSRPVVCRWQIKISINYCARLPHGNEEVSHNSTQVSTLPPHTLSVDIVLHSCFDSQTLHFLSLQTRMKLSFTS